LLRLFASYALIVAALALLLRFSVRLNPARAPSETRIVSVWRDGARIDRAVVRGELPARFRDRCLDGSCTSTVERIVDEGPLPHRPSLLFALSIAAGRDGIAVQLGDRHIYLTPDDLLAQQASHVGAKIGQLELRIGLDDGEAMLDRIAAELQVDRAGLERARFRRFIVKREDPSAGLWPLRAARAETLDAALLERGVRSAADYLVRNQAIDGHFDYEIDTVHGTSLPGYDWPRHGGALLMLSQVANRTGDRGYRASAFRAARLVQRRLTVDCGAHRCIGEGVRVDAGAAALTLLAYVELARGGMHGFDDDVRALSSFLRSLQRRDGEFMHVYDRAQRRPLDIQLPYYTGEVALALARTYRVSHDPADLHAASAGLAHLVRRSVFQNRYQYGTEHWTCQALEELWEFAPDRDALAFCLDYQAFNRQFQTGSHSEFGDYEGGFAPNPFSPPRITPTGSRSEGAVATLSTALASGKTTAELQPLITQVRRALAFLMRFQLNPGPRHLLRDPARVQGGMPGSPTDLSVRIDFQQHVAGAALRYLRLLEAHAL
ncbi:MAG TPA: hypothetical protein VGI70_18870, partial [Polyangiales bacterium]